MDSFMTTLGLSDYLSKKRNLLVTIDGVHLNHTGASNLAFLISNILWKG